MCGIFGVFTDTKWGFSQKQLDVLGQNIIINQFRGTDSTGVFQVNKEGKSSMLKVLGGARDLFTNEAWDEFQATIKREASLVVGHGRAATRGSVKIENAHPFAKTFETGEILKLVHNGTLEYQQDLPDFDKFNVDSEWIAEMLVRFGPKEVLGKIRGAMALVWWDEKAKTINFFRNNDRPLHFGQFEGQYEKTFILNSESAAVRYLAARNGLKSMEKDDVFYFPPYMHAALRIGDLFGKWSTWEKVEPPKARVYVPEKWNDRRHRYAGPSQYFFGEENEEDILGWARPRSFNDDLEALRRNIYQSVEWVEIADKKGDWHRLTVFPNFSSLREPVVEPYLSGLRKMERVEAAHANNKKQWWVRLTYWDAEKQQTYHTMVGAEDPVTKQINPKANPTDWRDDEYASGFVDVGVKKLSPGRKFRWTSKKSVNPNEVIRHSAVIGDAGGHVLKGYKNSVDGSFVIGDQIIMEVSDVVPVKIGDKEYFRLDGMRSNPTGAQDACVDCVAYAEKGTPLGDAVEATPINDYNVLAGMIDRIELATKDWHLDTNSYVILVLRDWEMLEDMEEEPGKTTSVPLADMPY